MSRVIASIADRFSTAGMNISISWPVSANCGERDFAGRRNARIEASGIGGICATKETRIRRYTPSPFVLFRAPPRLCSPIASPPSGLSISTSCESRIYIKRAGEIGTRGVPRRDEREGLQRRSNKMTIVEMIWRKRRTPFVSERRGGRFVFEAYPSFR